MRFIVDDLLLLAKACLALTCRTFYWLLGDVLRSPELHHPPSMGFEQDSVRTTCLKSRRWEFIRFLEEGRLLACSSCLKLHPFTEFRPNQIVFKGHDSRVCHLGYYSGFIDLCPCVKMTFRDKLQLVDEWKRFLASKPKSADARYFWHRCSRSIMGGIVTYQTIIFSRFGVNGSLVLDIDYTFNFKGPVWVLSHLERRVCPHHSIFEFITFELPCPLAGTPDYIVWCTEHGCPICQTTVPILECWRTDDFTFMRFTITRNLGNAGHFPDATWYTQTSFSGDNVPLAYWEQRYEVSNTNPSLVDWNSPHVIRQFRRWESPVNSRSRRQTKSR